MTKGTPVSDDQTPTEETDVEDVAAPEVEPEKVAEPVEVVEEDFPSVEEKDVQRGDVPDPNEGWTVQSEASYVEVESVPGYTVQKHELPTVEGLKAHVTDPVAYVAGVTVVK